MGLLDFLSPESGQRRRQWLDGQTGGLLDALQYYIGPGVDVRQMGGILGMLNPVQDIGEAMGNARDGDYTGAAINTASALMPIAGAKLAGGQIADDVGNIISDTLTNVGTKAQGAMQAGQAFAADEFGGVGIPQKAKEAARLIQERYGIEPEFSYHPTSWGNSAYVNVRLPGPDGTYVDTGFRLSDHGTGEARKATDGIPTFVDDDSVSADSLLASITDAYNRAMPDMQARVAKRLQKSEIRDVAVAAWGKADEATKAAASQAYKASAKGRAGRLWKNLSPQEKAIAAYENGIFGNLRASGAAAPDASLAQPARQSVERVQNSRGEQAAVKQAVSDSIGSGQAITEIVRKYGIAGAAAMLGVSASEVQAAMGQQQQPQGLFGSLAGVQ